MPNDVLDFLDVFYLIKPPRSSSLLLLLLTLLLNMFPYFSGFHLNNKLSSIFPESCLLIILGIVVGVIVYITLYFNDNEEINGGVAAEASQYTLHATTFFQVSLFCETESGYRTAAH